MSFRSLRRWLQVKTGRVDTPIDGEVPFWIFSLAFHLILLIMLARVIMPSEPELDVQLTLQTDDPVEEQLDDIPPEINFDDIAQEEIGANSEDAFDVASSEAPIIDMINEDPVEIDIPSHDIGELMTDDDLMEASAETISTTAVKGNVGQAVSGAAGAVDRITQEILRSLNERKTTVVWMFDQSASLMRQRAEIVDRFDKIYKELGLIRESGNESFGKYEDEALLTQVYSFGQNLTPMLKDPTEKLDTIKAAINKIELDRSGIENVFSATIAVANDFKKERRINNATGDRNRNVMIIVVSDEAGDDGARIDECVKTVTKLEIPVYVVGVPAPFGRQETLVKWVDPDPQFDQSPQWASVSQGPESLMPERIQLDYTGNVDDLEMIDSGFGPFNLTRLSYESGGIYFAVHPNRDNNGPVRMRDTEAFSAYLRNFFDPRVMRKYKPDYVSRQTYLKRIQANKTREALVQAAAYTSTGVLQAPTLRFEKIGQNAEASFNRSITTAQQSAALVEPALRNLYDMLKTGEKDRDQEQSPRWCAGYDLAMGRVMAAKLRAESYNQMLAMAKTKLKFSEPKNKDTPRNNVWELRPANTVSTGSSAQKTADKAKAYLQKVIDEHPKTPWAMLAERELSTPIGWKWVESYKAPPAPRTMARNVVNNNNNNVQPPRNPQPRQNAMPKPKRTPPKL